MFFIKQTGISKAKKEQIEKLEKQEYLTLNEIINNIYKNSKLSAEEYQNQTSPIYTKITECLQKFADYCKLETNVIQHGSYKLNTLLMYPSKYNDIDIDIGMTISNLRTEIEPKIIKQLLFDYLKKSKLKYDSIEQKSCAITLKFKKDNIHVDIVVYRMNNGKQEVAWKNKWIHEEKNQQYEILKNVTSNNDSVKKIICFLKFLYKNGKINEGYELPSIILTEIVIQDYANEFKKFVNKKYPYQSNEYFINNLDKIKNLFEKKEYYNIGKKLLTLLEDTYDKFLTKFELKNSGGHNENFFNNHKNIGKKKLEKDKVLGGLFQIYKELYNYYNEQYVRLNDIILRNVLYGSNKMLILPEEIYGQYKNNSYKTNKYIERYFNKCIKYAQPIDFV